MKTRMPAFKAYIRRNAPYLILMVFVFCAFGILLFDRMVISIHSGELGILWRRLGGGTVIDQVYGEGVHVILPFDKMYIYSIRQQQVSDSIDALTVDGLTVHVRYSVRYFLSSETLPTLHQRVGPDFVNVVINPEIHSVIRTIFGQYKPEEIYTAQKMIQERINDLSKIRLESRFIELDDVPIESIALPAKISQAIETKMAYQQAEGEYVFRLSIAQKEAERKSIEAQGQAVYNDTLSKSINANVLSWYGIVATQELAKSPNAKTVVIGGGKGGLPLILGKD